jgi:heme-degrading monooxygenase HmoA
MILERVEFTAKDGMAEAFAAAMDGTAMAILLRGEGCRSARAGRGVENPDKIILLVEWDSLELHNQFRGSPPHVEFGGIVGPFVAGAVMEHFDLG